MTPNLPDLRLQIDKLDKELLALLNQRAHVAEQVGEVKRREGSPFFRPDRVAAVIDKIQQANTGPLKNEHVAAIWREIMSSCLALEAPVRVAYLGPAGTFSEQAALNFFGASIEHVACSSIDEVFRSTAGGSANYGVVPVENSTEGVVSRSLDLFLNSPLHIIGETSLLVRHNLLRLSDSLEGIEVVYAHPQALAQCHAWLTAHLCPMSNAAQPPATPKAPVWPPRIQLGPASPATAQARSLVCTQLPTRFKTTPSIARALSWSACRKRCPRRRLPAKTASA
jgi:chorismate mutase/prephenate dehydratase